MPGKAFQSSRPLVVAAGAGPLSQPTGRVVYALEIPAAIAGTIQYDFAGLAGIGFRVIDCWLVKTVGNEAAVASTIQLRTAAGAAISDAMSINGLADTGIVRAGTIDDATHVVAAGIGLQVNQVTAGGTTNSSCIVYVEVALLSGVVTAQAFQSGPALLASAGPALPAPSMICTLALAIPDMATGDVDFTGVPGMSFRVLDVAAVKLNGAGGGVNTAILETAGGVAITDAIDLNIADQAISKAATISDATHVIAAGGGLRVAIVKAAGDTTCVVYVTIALLGAVAPARVVQSTDLMTQNIAAAGLPRPSLEVVLAVTIPQAPGNLDLTGLAGFGLRIIDLWFVKTDALAGGASTLQLQTAAGAANVTDALNINTADEVIVRAGQINDVSHDFAASAGMRIATTGGDCRGQCYIRAALR